MLRIIGNSRAIIATSLFALFSCLWILTGCASSTSNETSDSFEKVMGAKLDPQLQLVTNRKQYREPQAVGYEVLNNKAVSIYFADYTYGVRAYTYDKKSQMWVLFSWDFDLIDPKIMIIPPGPHKPAEHAYVLGLSDLPASGTVRLAVVGWLDPNNPEDSKIAAYTDIEIVR